MVTTLESPPAGWWGPLPREERIWIGLIVLSVIVTSAITLAWLGIGQQNVPVVSRSMSPDEFEMQLQAFQERFNLPDGSVRVPPGEDAYLSARIWSFTPVLRLKAGQTYNIWVSARDVLHGVSIAGQNLNIMAAPGHAYRIRITPKEPGEYLVFCNEYCGIGHHAMQGRIIVEE